jgi:hypothetical protein
MEQIRLSYDVSPLPPELCGSAPVSGAA